MIPYGKWRSVALRWVILKIYMHPFTSLHFFQLIPIKNGGKKEYELQRQKPINKQKEYSYRTPKKHTMADVFRELSLWKWKQICDKRKTNHNWKGVYHAYCKNMYNPFHFFQICVCENVIRKPVWAAEAFVYRRTLERSETADLHTLPPIACPGSSLPTACPT